MKCIVDIMKHVKYQRTHVLLSSIFFNVQTLILKKHVCNFKIRINFSTHANTNTHTYTLAYGMMWVKFYLTVSIFLRVLSLTVKHIRLAIILKQSKWRQISIGKCNFNGSLQWMEFLLGINCVKWYVRWMFCSNCFD